MQLEAARLAFAMRDAFVADPDMADVPVEHLLSDAVIDDLAGRVDRQAAGARTWARCRSRRAPIRSTSPSSTRRAWRSRSSTRSTTTSAPASSRSKTGVVLHNRGKGFVCDPGHRNCIAPRKRPMHTLVPAMVLKDGKPHMAFGVMGAHFQPMGHVYVMTNMFHYGMDPQQAIDTPRVFFDGDTVLVEEAVPAAVVAGLQAARPPRGGARHALGRRPGGGHRPRRTAC